MITWAWACHKSEEKNILWIGCYTSTVCCVLFENGRASPTLHTASRFTEIVENCHADVIIVDGVVQTDNKVKESSPLGPVLVWARKFSQRKRGAIFVASHSAVLNMRDRDRWGIKVVYVPSWSKLDYRSACENDTFYSSVQNHLKEDGVTTRWPTYIYSPTQSPAHPPLTHSLSDEC